MRKIHLVLIDPQNSFCKVVDPAKQAVEHDGELCVPGAWDDMGRVAAMVKRLGKKIDRLWSTLDSHQWNHIAHPGWWKDMSGKHPAPFTSFRVENDKIIGSQFTANGSVDVGQYTTTIPGLYTKSKAYLEELLAHKRYLHMIWPPHCLIGSVGATIVAPLYQELLNWCEINFRTIEFVTKGSNPFVEHFSAIQAEVPDPQDPTTQLNSEFIQNVMEGDEILIAGEARSHCLANTIRDAANSFGDDSFISKCTLLTDGCSDVPNCEQLGKDFVDEMTKRGMKLSTTIDILS